MTSIVGSKIKHLFSPPSYFLKKLIQERKCFNNTRIFSTAASSINLQRVDQLQKAQLPLPDLNTDLSQVEPESKFLKYTFSNGTEGKLPYVWLRDNCQCSTCFDYTAFSRKSLLIDLDVDIKPQTIEFNTNDVTVTWTDSHVSTFDSQWLLERSFMPKSIESYKNFFAIDKEPWGKDVIIDRFNYEELFGNENLLLSWLNALERKGITIVQNCPKDVDAAPKLINRIGYVKITHYGIRSPVKKRESQTHLSYGTHRLGLHNDQPYYNYTPGIVFLNTLKKHEGEGGSSILSDGLLGVNLFKEKNPKGYKLLCEKGIYFWDKGVTSFYQEKNEFHKINKSPVIELDCDGNFYILRISTWGRDSHMFLPHELMYDYYKALLELNRIIYQNSISYKMEDGEMLVLDNYRCLHGREEYSSQSSRHLETSYMDWDEAKCTRRCLQEKLLAN